METSKQSFHVRSVSMPTPSHPAVLEVEENLNKLRAFSESSASATSAEKICNGLTQLSELYHGINNLLQLPSIQQTLCNLKELESNVDRSVRLLDVCGSLKDSSATIKEHVQGLQLVLRRAGENVAQEKVHAYIRSRKETQKAFRKSYKEMKQIDGSLQSVSAVTENSEVVIKVLSEAKEITVSLVCSVISFMSMSTTTTPKTSKWSLISKAIQRKRVTCEADLSDVQCLDAMLCASLKDACNALVQSQLKATEISLGGLTNGLECLFKRLIQNRVALLNILSL